MPGREEILGLRAADHREQQRDDDGGNDDPSPNIVQVAQGDARFMSIIARSRGDAISLTPAVRDAVAIAVTW